MDSNDLIVSIVPLYKNQRDTSRISPGNNRNIPKEDILKHLERRKAAAFAVFNLLKVDEARNDGWLFLRVWGEDNSTAGIVWLSGKNKKRLIESITHFRNQQGKLKLISGN